MENIGFRRTAGRRPCGRAPRGAAEPDRRGVLIGAGALRQRPRLCRPTGGRVVAGEEHSDIDHLQLRADVRLHDGRLSGQGLNLLTDARQRDRARDPLQHRRPRRPSTIETSPRSAAPRWNRRRSTSPTSGTATATPSSQAAAFAELGVSGYHGQITNIEAAEVLAPPPAWPGTKSRHAAISTALPAGTRCPRRSRRQDVEEVLEARLRSAGRSSDEAARYDQGRGGHHPRCARPAALNASGPSPRRRLHRPARRANYAWCWSTGSGVLPARCGRRPALRGRGGVMANIAS